MIKPEPGTVFSAAVSWTNKIALAYLLLFLLCAIFADWLPLSFPPNEPDLDHVYQPPFQWHLKEPGKPFHWLGTDKIGRDVLSNIVVGARTALLVSVPAMVVATVLGIFLGSIAGYYGDKSYKQSLASILAAITAFLWFIFYSFWIADSFLLYNLSVSPTQWKIIVLLLAILLYRLLVWLLQKIGFLQKMYFLPLDFLVLKIIELLQSVPRLLLVLCLASFVDPSLAIVIGLSALTYWPAIARLVRAEMLKLKELPFVEATRALGFSDFRIIVKHALPNALTPVIVAVAFGIGNLIALESTLSFMGIGLPADLPSWGRTVNSIGGNLVAWWLVLFPGLVLCFTVLALQGVAQLLIKRINPK
jgi:peptide/nickel transport system permease protein